MGKSIVHCAVCGKAIREEDFADRKAVSVDHRTYCFQCIPAELARLQAAPPPKSSTSRIPLVQTPRRAMPIAPKRSPLPLVLGIGAAVLLAVAGFILTRGNDKSPDPEPDKVARRAASDSRAPAPSAESRKEPAPAAARKEPVAAPAPTPKPGNDDFLPATAKPKSLNPTITSPVEGAAFDASASVTVRIDAPDDAERVEVYEGPTKIGEATERPFAVVWKDVPGGTHALTAKSTHKDGRVLMSLPVSIKVAEAAAAATPAPEPAPEPKKPPPGGAVPVDLGVDPKRVDDAIARGTAWLKAQAVKDAMNPAAVPGLGECPELVLWTLVHARVSENDPDFVKLWTYVMGRKLERTYQVALQAMILEEVNRVKYQVRIAQCAQFLMDAQCGNGQWSYGGSAQIGTPTLGLKSDVATGGSGAAAVGNGERVKPKVVRKITSLRKMQEGPATGDNSNSQYAALGLRACYDAGIMIPKAVIQRAQTWWRISQHDEEGGPEKRPAVSTGDGGPAAGPAGWCYGPKDHGHAAYSSMTAGAVGSVAIWNFLHDEKTWKKDPTLLKGIAWIERHFTVTGNDGPSEHVADTKWMVYYYLYALERAGVLAGTETFGTHRWYVEGAEAILGAQRADGSWIAPLPHGDRSETTNATWDTCFAILFLKRATRPLVVSSDARVGK